MSEHKIIAGKAFFSLQQVAKKIDISYQTALNWSKKGELVAKKIGGRYYVSVVDYDNFIQGL